MSLRRIYNGVIGIMITLIIITASIIWHFNELTAQSRQLNQAGIRLITLCNEMLHTNDYLVKLTRVYIHRGEEAVLNEYKELSCYKNLEGKLDSMLETGLTEDETVRVKHLFEALHKMSSIEAEAIEAYNSGDHQRARDIIYGNEYSELDFQLATETKNLIASITERVRGGVYEIQSQLEAMKLLASLFMILSVVCMALLQLVLKNRILKPVLEIEDVMGQMSGGNVGVRLTKKRNDEIGSLYDRINSMADSIEDYMEDSRNSYNILKSILNGIDTFIYVTDPETDIILFINEPMKKHYGIEGDGFGNYCYKVLQEGIESRCDFCPCYRLDENPGEIVTWEEQSTITGRTYQNSDSYIEWLGGLKVHMQHSVDITDIKKFSEDKLLAERRAMEMKNEKEKAEARAQAKNDFLAKMSHEIRTPMNAVMGMSEIILRKSLPQDIYENVLGIKNASMNLLSIINDILDFSKIESGMMELVETEFALPSLINDVIGIIRIRLIDKPIQFAVEIDPELPASLIGDELRIRQVLINILGNAVKYTNTGFISLNMTGKREEQRVLLRADVEDSGIGVKEEDKAKLFGDFVQIDTEKNRGVVGTGLGLAISRDLCRLMGGDITLESVYEKGSVFTIEIPLKYNDYEPLAKVDKQTDMPLLLYETRPIYKKAVESALKSLGVSYKAVESIPELFESLEGCPYAFISSFMYGSIGPALSKLESPPKLVLLSDITETFAPKNARLLALPAYCLTVANVLNDVYEDYDTSGVTDISFTAPEAKVLIVDDVTANLKVCEGLLAPYEMQITLCGGGKEAVEAVRANPYDLVFMDHMMPEVDGIEATRQIRETEGVRFKELPIVALTANAVSGVREMFIQNGMNDFLPKPIETAKLDKLLEKWIPKAKRKKAAAPKEPEAPSPFVENLKAEPELSVDKALSIVGGSHKTYERVVKLSVKLLPENIQRLNSLIEAHLPNYSIEVHGIKGVLNNMGAYGLGALAYELEELSKNGDSESCLALHPPFIEKLAAFSDRMGALVDSGENASQKAKGSLKAVSEALSDLEEAADYCDNMAALKILTRLNADAYGQEVDSALSELAEAFQRFDFDEGLAIIENLKNILDGEGP